MESLMWHLTKKGEPHCSIALLNMSVTRGPTASWTGAPMDNCIWFAGQMRELEACSQRTLRFFLAVFWTSREMSLDDERGAKCVLALPAIH